jgi:Secretion system C-terminal sorting domain
MEYTKYPESMPPLLKFSGVSDNVGANPQTDVKLKVDVQSLDGSNTLHTGESTEGTFLFSGMTSELRAGTFQMPSDVGAYRILFETNQNEVEEFEVNNRDTAVFFIDEVQYARDALFTTAVYLGLPEYENVQYEIGNVFLVTAPNQTCHSITVAVGLGSSTPTNIYGALYSIDITSSIDVTLLGTTQPVAITADMFNGYADQILTNLTFDAPIAVEEGTAYFVAVGTQDGIDNFVCAMAGNAYEQTSFVRFFPSDWYYLDRIPMVRMNFGFFNGTREIKAEAAELSVFPVPASNHVVLNLSSFLHEDVRIDIIDQGGRIVKTIQEKKLMTENYELNIANFSEGLYQLFVHNERTLYSGRFIKQ